MPVNASEKSNVAGARPLNDHASTEPDAVADMTCLPESLADRQYYRPVDRGFEKEIRKRLEDWRAKKKNRR